MENTIIPVSGQIQGNITDCKIETARISVDKQWVGSLTQISTFRSYDVCTKQPIKDFSIQQLTGFGIFLGVFATILLIAIFCSWASSY